MNTSLNPAVRNLHSKGLNFAFVLSVWAILALLFIAAPIRAEQINAVCTATMVSDLVRQVGGDRVNVVELMGPGVDPHLYKPSAGDSTKLAKADVIFYVGLMLEGRMADLFSRMGRQGKPVYAVSEQIPRDKLLEPEEFEGHWDPHIWGDPRMWSDCVGVVVEGLSKADPEGAAHFKKKGEAYKKILADLYTWGKKRAQEVPANSRILVTSHDAFNYFGRAFEFSVIGVQGISTTTEAGLADIAKTVDFIKDNKIKAIFVETSVNPAAIERISKDSGAKIGGELFSDAMGKPGQMESGGGEKYDAGTYVGMIKHNVNTAVDALK